MTRTNVASAGEQLLESLAALLVEKGAMARRIPEIRKAARRVKPQRRAPVRLSREVYEANVQHAEAKTCVCGCGGLADSKTRGRTPEHYEQFRSKRQAKERLGGKEEAERFDREWQLKGLIFPPLFNPDEPFVDYDANAEWEEKRLQIERAGKP
jgi:hypothetical protein